MVVITKGWGKRCGKEMEAVVAGRMERERTERGREELKKSKVDLGIRFQKAEEGERKES